MNFKWTDQRVKDFARVASQGAYGDYRGCNKMAQKLARFKELNTPLMSVKQATSYLMREMTSFNLVSCPKELLQNKREADVKLIQKAYYDLHCMELGI